MTCPSIEIQCTFQLIYECFASLLSTSSWGISFSFTFGGQKDQLSRPLFYATLPKMKIK